MRYPWRALLPVAAILVPALVLGAPMQQPGTLLSAGAPPDPLPWSLENEGTEPGVPDADVDARAAWEITTGDREVVVAVIDTGVDATHPALLPAIRINAGETPGNGLDDDLNGLVDDVTGWDFADDDADPTDAGLAHGTLVAGLIAGAETGLAPGVSILPVKVFSSSGSDPAFEQAAADGILYALDQGARVLQIAWELSGAPGPVLQAAFDAALAEDVLVVIAAGNDGLDLDVTPSHPASLGLPNMIVVAGTDRYDRPVDLPTLFVTNEGAGTVHLAAPTEKVTTTFPGGGTLLFTGTSAAAPFVSATAALVWSVDPGATAAEVKDAILRGVDRLPQLEGRVASGGRLNAANAVRLIAAPDAQPPVAAAGALLDGAAARPLVYDGSRSRNPANGAPPAAATWWFGDGGVSTALSVEHAFAEGGRWPATLEVVDADGLRAVDRTRTDVPFLFEPRDADLQSAHPYTGGTHLVRMLTVEGATWIRLHFAEIGLAAGDALILFDGTRSGVEVLQGSDTDRWSEPIRGDTAFVYLRGFSGGGHGYTLDGVEAQFPGRANRAPIARVDGGAGVRPGDAVAFSAEASEDPDGDPLLYAWRIVTRPEGSSAEPVPADGPSASLTPDREGAYALAVTVSDGTAESSALVWTVTRPGEPAGCRLGGNGSPRAVASLLLLLAAWLARRLSIRSSRSA